MSGYLHFIPEFVLCTNSSLFWFRIANKLSEFRNYLFVTLHIPLWNIVVKNIYTATRNSQKSLPPCCFRQAKESGVFYLIVRDGNTDNIMFIAGMI